jgi:hypothetical protein
LDTWILAQQWYFTSGFVDNQQQRQETNLMQDLEPIDPLPNHPKSFWGCIISELGWLRSNGLGAKVIGYLDSGPQNDITQADLLTTSSSQTNLMQDLEPMDPLPNHPKSFLGCIKWIGMVEKQWFGCHKVIGHLDSGPTMMIFLPWCWLDTWILRPNNDISLSQ